MEEFNELIERLHRTPTDAERAKMDAEMDAERTERAALRAEMRAAVAAMKDELPSGETSGEENCEQCDRNYEEANGCLPGLTPEESATVTRVGNLYLHEALADGRGKTDEDSRLLAYEIILLSQATIDEIIKARR